MEPTKYEELKNYIGKNELKGLEESIAEFTVTNGAIIIRSPGVKTIIPRPDLYDGPDY